MQKIFCPDCGKDITEKGKVCPECGADIQSFSVRKIGRSFAGENSKEIKKEITQTESEKTEGKYSLSQPDIAGIIILSILILVVVSLPGFAALFHGIQPGMESTKQSIPVQPVLTTQPMELRSPPETTFPEVEITYQTCTPGRSSFLGVGTVLKNNLNTTVSGDFILKGYNKSGGLLGTFKQSITIPPRGDKWTGIVMYGFDYHNTSSMSIEYPGLSPTLPPREISGFPCPVIREV